MWTKQFKKKKTLFMKHLDSGHHRQLEQKVECQQYSLDTSYLQ
jgi:hypothetical protein